MKSPRPATIHEATANYEAWLSVQIPLVQEDLERKHERMSAGLHPFLRATYFRWAQHWQQAAEAVRTARGVLAVGDLHVENFGTWRDVEGRLIWGINDFDEATRLPYTHDLARLAASARAAIAAQGVEMSGEAIDAAILGGYRESLESGGRPFVVGQHRHLVGWVESTRIERHAAYWKRLGELPPVGADHLPASALRALHGAMPSPDLVLRYAGRVAGLGSLGRQRYVALADWYGGTIAREVKAVARAASFWAVRGEGETRDLYRAILAKAVRCPDPSLTVKRRWIVRRLAPDCARIELADLPKKGDLAHLLQAMGWETANIHLGSSGAHALLLDLASRPEGWLGATVEPLLTSLEADWKAWAEGSEAGSVPKSGKGTKRKEDGGAKSAGSQKREQD